MLKSKGSHESLLYKVHYSFYVGGNDISDVDFRRAVSSKNKYIAGPQLTSRISINIQQEKDRHIHWGINEKRFLITYLKFFS